MLTVDKKGGGDRHKKTRTPNLVAFVTFALLWEPGVGFSPPSLRTGKRGAMQNTRIVPPIQPEPKLP